MNKTQSSDASSALITPKAHVSSRGVNRTLQADAAGSVRRAFKQEIADQLTADIDCTEHLSPVCDCHLRAGYDDAANLLAEWRINVIHGHDEEYLGFRRLPARIPYSITTLPAQFNGLCSMCRGERQFRAPGCRACCHVPPTGPPISRERAPGGGVASNRNPPL